MKIKIDNKFIENLTAIYVVVGCCLTYTPMHYGAYMLSLILQIIALLIIKNSNRGTSIRHLLVCVLILFILVDFLIIDVGAIKIVNRILPLFSMFGIICLGDDALELDIEGIAVKSAIIFGYLSIIINIDAVRYLVMGSSIWHPIYYLGVRFVGPCQDANYLSVFCTTFLLILLYKGSYTKRTILLMASLFMCLVFARSLSVLLFLPITIIIQKFFYTSHNLEKQIFLLIIYFAILTIYSSNSSGFQSFSIGLLNHIYKNTASSLAKFIALKERFDAQSLAIQYFFKRPIGYGPRRLVELIGRDTHNSYIAIVFEEGIAGFLLLFSTMKRKVNNTMANCIGTFLMLNAFMLDIHTQTVYSLFILMQFMNEKEYITPAILKPRNEEKASRI